MEDNTVEKGENTEEDADSEEKEVSPEINFVAIKEEPEEENYVDENIYEEEEEFQFVSCDAEHKRAVESIEDTSKDQEKIYSKEDIKTEEPQKRGQKFSGYDPLYLCEVTFGCGNGESRDKGQADAAAHTSQASTASGTNIKKEVSVEDAEDHQQPRNEEEYYAGTQMKQETGDLRIINSYRHNRNLIIPDVLTSLCTQCDSSECQCLRVKRKRRSRKTVKMKFECEICQKVLASRKTLKQHQLTHSGIRNYFCPVCHKTFIQLRQLSEHRLIHTGIRKYQCETCNKSFTQRRTLAQHKLIHSDVKRYQCDVCSKAFLQRSSLAQHKFVHSNLRKHKCDVCDKAFSQHRKLSEHKLIHSGIKKYQCDICLKSFTQQRTLSQHRLIHSNVKNHKCDICDKAFTRRDTLLRHRLIHTNIKKKSVSAEENELTQNDIIGSENGVSLITDFYNKL